jgi:hypothetical protein
MGMPSDEEPSFHLGAVELAGEWPIIETKKIIEVEKGTKISCVITRKYGLAECAIERYVEGKLLVDHVQNVERIDGDNFFLAFNWLSSPEADIYIQSSSEIVVTRRETDYAHPTVSNSMTQSEAEISRAHSPPFENRITISSRL